MPVDAPTTPRRDQQRSAVYAWERELARRCRSLRRRLTLEECEAYVARVWRDHRPQAPAPALKDGRGRRSGEGTPEAIKLPRLCRRPYYVLHEVAHALHPESGHGPAFARLLLDLLARYEGVDRLGAMLLGMRQTPRRVRFSALDPLQRPPR